MTEAHLRQQIRCAAIAVANAAAAAERLDPPTLQRLVELAEEIILPAASDLVQEALEQGFCGRALASEHSE